MRKFRGCVRPFDRMRNHLGLALVLQVGVRKVGKRTADEDDGIDARAEAAAGRAVVRVCRGRVAL